MPGRADHQTDILRALKILSHVPCRKKVCPLAFDERAETSPLRDISNFQLKRFQFMLDRQYPATPSALSGHWRYPCFNENGKRSKAQCEKPNHPTLPDIKDFNAFGDAHCLKSFALRLIPPSLKRNVTTSSRPQGPELIKRDTLPAGHHRVKRLGNPNPINGGTV